jgi:FtsH-binding integral membrane protein
MGPRFFLRTLPVTFLMAITMAVGLLIGRSVRGPAIAALAVVGGVLCLVGGWTFRSSSWTPVLLVGLSFSVGLMAVRLAALADPSLWLWPALAAMVGIAAAALVGRAGRRLLHGLYPLVWVAAWIVVLGTIAAQLVGHLEAWLLVGAEAVIVVFLSLAAAWFARLEREPPPLAALDLYLIGLNLFLAAAVLRGGGT